MMPVLRADANGVPAVVMPLFVIPALVAGIDVSQRGTKVERSCGWPDKPGHGEWPHGWPEHRRANGSGPKWPACSAAPFFERLCPAMTAREFCAGKRENISSSTR